MDGCCKIAIKNEIKNNHIAADDEQDMINAYDKYYEDFYNRKDWWHGNKNNLRLCHKNTTCRSWEQDSKKEKVANQVKDGKYKLDFKI